jgi:hypothetical protein
MATTTVGKDDRQIDALPLDKVIPILKKYNIIHP